MAKVLVVDDSLIDRTLVGGLLGHAGNIEVLTATQGDEALEAAQRERPDLVIADLVMPRMDGFTFVGTMRERLPLIPVILMTSQGNEEIAVQALQAGAASYVPKRKLAWQLVDTVQKVLSVSGHQRAHARLMECMDRAQCSFTLVNDPTLFRPLVSYLQETATSMGLVAAADQTRLGMALEEGLANALYHGNLEIDSAMKEEDEAGYYALIEERKHVLPYSDRRIHVVARVFRDEGRFVIRDDGRGFDPTSLPDPTDPANLDRVSGRGILLMRTFMDEVAFNESGNEVTLVKRRRREPGEPPPLPTPCHPG